MLGDYQLLSCASLPTDNAIVSGQIYAGDIFLAPPNPFGEEFVRRMRQQITKALGMSSFDECRFSSFNPHERLAPVRAWLQHQQGDLAPLLQGMLEAMGFDPAACAMDYPRLRAIAPAALIPEGKSIYDVHRDTWYGNVETQINAWLPLHDVTVDQSFALYPDWFGKPIVNHSAGFDYGQWLEQIGWQTDKTTHADKYPHALQQPSAQDAYVVSAPKASCLLFSAQHLHGTLPNRSMAIRYSIDFRFVHRDDHTQGRGPQNVDNASRGCSLADYRYLQRMAA
jgi:hypothetical protein